MGLLENSIRDLSVTQREFASIRATTNQPFGVNLPVRYLQMDPKEESAIIDWLLGQGIHFVTTSAGDPTRYIDQLKGAGLTVFHVVPTLKGALKAVDAGVDGLIVEGGEGGGFKNPQDVASMVLLPLVRSKTDVPIIAAGGMLDGRTMAAAFALGAEGIQMGTRMVSSAESPVHDNWKNAIVGAAETDTVFLNRFAKPGLRALRTERSSRLEKEEVVNMMEFGTAKDLYFGGDMEASLALGGQVMGRIESVRPVADIIRDTVEEFFEIIGSLNDSYLGQRVP